MPGPKESHPHSEARGCLSSVDWSLCWETGVTHDASEDGVSKSETRYQWSPVRNTKSTASTVSDGLGKAKAAGSHGDSRVWGMREEEPRSLARKLPYRRAPGYWPRELGPHRHTSAVCMLRSPRAEGEHPTACCLLIASTQSLTGRDGLYLIMGTQRDAIGTQMTLFSVYALGPILEVNS